MEACTKSATNPIHKKIVDQIVAVDNFVAFKKLMCKRNAELNQQAIKMMAKMTEKKLEEEKKEADAKQAAEEKATPKTTPEDNTK